MMLLLINKHRQLLVYCTVIYGITHLQNEYTFKRRDQVDHFINYMVLNKMMVIDLFFMKQKCNVWYLFKYNEEMNYVYIY